MPPYAALLVAQLLQSYFEKSQSHPREAIEIRNKLVLLNRGLVRDVAHRVSQQCPEPYEDLEQIGYFGLIRAIENFNPSKGHAFSSFAVPWIEGEMQHFLRDQWGDSPKVSRRFVEKKSEVRRVRRQMANLGYEVGDELVATSTGISKDKWREIDEATSRRPLVPLTEILHISSKGAAEETEQQQLHRLMKHNLAKLPNPYRTCLQQKFSWGMNESAIARQHKVSSEKVVEWIAEGLCRLRTEQLDREIGNG